MKNSKLNALKRLVLILPAVWLMSCMTTQKSSKATLQKTDATGEYYTGIGRTPQIVELFFAEELGSATNPDIKSIKTGKPAVLNTKIKDQDWDIKSLTVQMEINGKDQAPVTTTFEYQYQETFVFSTPLEPREKGKWKAKVWLTDWQGNRSETKTVSITVN
ncbi:MAG: hypothetical protein J6Y69_02775 [Treponema sp.]|nr:hypothetical protein [Treponema sp.]